MVEHLNEMSEWLAKRYREEYVISDSTLPFQFCFVPTGVTEAYMRLAEKTFVTSNNRCNLSGATSIVCGYR